MSAISLLISDLRFQSWSEGYHQGLMCESETLARIAVALGKDADAWTHAASAVRLRAEYAKAKTLCESIVDKIDEVLS